LVAYISEVEVRSQHRESRRRTIAALIDYADELGSGYESRLRAGLERECQKRDIDLHFVVGRALGSSDPISAAHNAIYELVYRGGSDGTILVASGLGSVCGVERLALLASELQPTALCSVGIELPDVPSISIENHLGMAAVLEHIIEVHGCRRIAFIGGPKKNPDAVARFQVYRQVLTQYGLPFNPELIALGEFTFPTGMLAANVLLECGAKFDAIAAANDDMALGAIEALRQHGQRVPRDVRVVGFDDVVTARFSNPPLTTARQPLDKMANLAIEYIVAQWEGRVPPVVTQLPVEVVARRSCGCLFRKGRHSIPPSANPRSQPFTPEHTTRLAQQLDRILTQSDVTCAVTGERLLQAVQGECDGQRDAFLAALDALLDQATNCSEFFDDIQNAVTLLRDEFNSVGVTHLEDLWDTARCTIALASTREQSEQRTSVELTYRNLLHCGERLSSVPDVAALGRVLGQELPLVPVKDVFVAVCPGERQELRPIFGLCGGHAVQLPDAPIEARRFLRMTREHLDRRTTTFALPLTFEGKYLGAVVFVPEAGLGACAMLREQISFALNTIDLHQELAKRTALQERSVQERIAATARMETLSVMAGGVAHDLNSALSPLVALPDAILGLVNRLGVDTSPDGQRLRHYVSTIKAAASRATETIRDLMTLGRQGRTPKARLDLNWVAASCVSAEPSLTMRSEANRLEVCMDLTCQPLLVNASQYHIERAISNLIRNAVEAVGERGTLTVRTAVARFEKPAGGLEPVAPGEYAMLAISDTGPGIPRDLIKRVFEPFFSNKTLRDSSGSGLGLSIVHGVVKEHEGYIDVSSERGHGTTFTLYFPLASNPPATANGSQPSVAPASADRGSAGAGPDNSEAVSVPKRIDAA
jgi:DNA-binding LacI/PurR family transcriptional regulator/signal transduction histidine kinase